MCNILKSAFKGGNTLITVIASYWFIFHENDSRGFRSLTQNNNLKRFRAN